MYLLFIPQDFAWPFFPISPGYYSCPKKNRKKKNLFYFTFIYLFIAIFFFFWGGGEALNKVHYGIGENGQFRDVIYYVIYFLQLQSVLVPTAYGVVMAFMDR